MCVVLSGAKEKIYRSRHDREARDRDLNRTQRNALKFINLFVLVSFSTKILSIFNKISCVALNFCGVYYMGFYELKLWKYCFYN